MNGHAYDEFGNVLTYTDKNDRLSSIIDNKGTVRYNYDEAGNLTAETDKNGNNTVYGYDEFNRLISVTKGGGETGGKNQEGNYPLQTLSNKHGIRIVGQEGNASFSYDKKEYKRIKNFELIGTNDVYLVDFTGLITKENLDGDGKWFFPKNY